MRRDSVIIRIWLPVLLSSLFIFLLLALYLPKLQSDILKRSKMEELNILSMSVGSIVEIGLQKEDFQIVERVFQEYSHLENVSLIGLLTEDIGKVDVLRMIASGDSTTQAKYLDMEGPMEGLALGQVILNIGTTLIDTYEFTSNLGVKYVVVVKYDESKFNNELAQLRLPFYVLQALLAIGTLWLLYYLIFRISRPFYKVVSLAEEMRDGNFNVEISDDSRLYEMGALTHALIRLRDDLERRREENESLNNDMEYKIIERTEQLQIALQAKDKFLSTMSHEIRTPLHSLISIAEILQSEGEVDQKKQLLESLKTSSKHLLSLINDILDFSKISDGKFDLHLEPVHLSSFFEELVSPFELAKKPNIIFIKSWPDCLSDYLVEADSMRLSQILNNLLSNAFKFTEEGEVRFEIICNTLEDKGSRFLEMDVKISDTGIGIAKENIEFILQAFTQESSSISRKFGGTGLGLSIVIGLLRMMDSKLEIHSKLGQESTFGFSLKLPLLDFVNTPKPEAVEIRSDSDNFDGLRMLYVEDMEPNRFVMEVMVKLWNVELDLAESGFIAIELLRENQYDIVLMDIQMPEMDGIETLQQIFEIFGPSWDTPVVAFTAHAQDSDVLNYRSKGFRDVLTKPAGPAVLREFLLTYVNQSSD